MYNNSIEFQSTHTVYIVAFHATVHKEDKMGVTHTLAGLL